MICEGSWSRLQGCARTREGGHRVTFKCVTPPNMAGDVKFRDVVGRVVHVDAEELDAEPFSLGPRRRRVSSLGPK